MKSIAIAAVLGIAMVSSGAAQEPVYVKDPSLATALSIIFPGGGQLYTERNGKAAVIAGVGLGGVGIGLLQYSRSQCAQDGGGSNCSSYGAVVYGGVAALSAWLYGVATAGNDARKYNAEHSAMAMRARPCISRDVAELDGQDLAVKVYFTEATESCTEYRCKFKGGGLDMRFAEGIRKCREQTAVKRAGD